MELNLFDSSLQLTIEKFQWVERNLPRYIPERLYRTLALEAECGDKIQEIVKSAIITDIIYAVVKNANWHTSDLFQAAIKMHLNQRYGVCPLRTLREACELLGNSTSDHYDDAEERFLIVYLLAWQDSAFCAERLSGLSFCFGDHLKAEGDNPRAMKIAYWMKDLKERQRLWEADELRVSIDLNPDAELSTGELGLFSRLFEILSRTKSHPEIAEKLVKVGILFCLDPDKPEYGLTKEGEWITTRYVIENCLETALDAFLNWCEIWQKAFFKSTHPGLNSILQTLSVQGEYPRIGAIPEYMLALEQVLGAETARRVLIFGLSGQESAWVKAALLAAGKHLLTENELPELAGNLLNSNSDTIQRVTADILFS